MSDKGIRRCSVIVVLLTMSALACQESVDTPTSRNAANDDLANRPAIGVSLLTSTNPFFVEMEMTMKRAGFDLGYRVDVAYADLDPETQARQVNEFIKQGVKAIVLSPVDSKAISPAIKKANEAGIPVFTADIAVLDDTVEVVSHVATDNYRGGQLAAQAMAEALSKGGKVAIIDHPEVESAMLRTRGFETRLRELRAEQGLDFSVVAKVVGKGDRDLSYVVTKKLLEEEPELDGIFAINDPSALGAVKALEEAGRLDDVVVIGFDAQGEALEALVAEKIYADVLQLPKKIGSLVVQSVDEHRAGKPVPPERLIPPTLIKKPVVEEVAPATAAATTQP